MEKEDFEILETKGEDLSKWLKDNFDPYVVIVITDTEVKLIRTELSVPIKLN